MKYLFVHSNMKFLESLAFTNTLYAFDFDGTLSKIVRVPGEARLAPKTGKLLTQLARHVRVAIVSGRGLNDLKTRLDSDGMTLIGNHGIEGFDNHSRELATIKGVCKGWHQTLTGTWIARARDPYIELEDKSYSLSLHYRRSRKKKKARELALKAIGELQPKPRIIYGKSVINIMPTDSPHKGNAIIRLMEKSDAKKIFYVGDDETDESVFGINESKVFSVRVGQSRNSKALYYIKNQSQVNKLLSSLIKIITKIKKGQKYE